MSFIHDVVAAATTPENAAFVDSTRETLKVAMDDELVSYGLLTIVRKEGEYPILCNEAMKWLGYEPGSFKKLYTSILRKDDYKALPRPDGKKGAQVWFTIDGFKTVCMAAEGERGECIRKYYTNLIETMSRCLRVISTKAVLKSDLAIDNQCWSFSDGTSVAFEVHDRKIRIQNSADDENPFRPLDEAHGNVVFSDTAIIVYLTAGPLPVKGILLPAPVKVVDVMNSINDFYSTKISPTEYAALQDWKYNDDYRPDQAVEDAYKVYGDIQCGYWFEGLRQRQFRKEWWNPLEYPRPEYPPYVGCRHTCEIYKTYDVKWGT